MLAGFAKNCRWTIAASLCMMLAGCSTLPKRGVVSDIDPATLDDTGFIHYLASVPTVSVAEGVRGVLLLRGATERWPTYDEQSAELVRAGAMQTSWELAPDDTLDMGTLGYMLRATCSLSPSVNERIATVAGRGERRYALRRCIDAGLLPYANSAQAVRGGELVAALAKSEKYVDPPAPPPPTEKDVETP